MSSEEDRTPLGLFAVFYDGETQPVAAFVLEQDAERYAKTYQGDCKYEIKHVHVVTDVALDAAISKARVEQREVDAKECEALVTFTEDHQCKCEPCAWCTSLETAAATIRAGSSQRHE